MTRNRWIVLAALVAALVAVQAAGLDRQPEWEEEKRYFGLGDVKASEVLPTYVASLFFGSFRAVAIDVLWIQLKKVEEEKRWYERREILKLISYFQPRNPEVWAHLGWHSAYNVANSFTDEERSWEWFEFGLRWLHDGTRQLPQNAYLKEQIAWTLYHKPTWREGLLDLRLMRRFERDEALQRRLQEREKPDRPMSMPELSIRWYQKANETMRAKDAQVEQTPMGLILRPSTMDGFIHHAMYFQGIYLWGEGRHEEAKDWFVRAEKQVVAMTGRYGGEIPILENFLVFYRGLPAVVDLERAARGGDPKAERAYLDGLLRLTLDTGPYTVLDRDFLWSRENPQVPLNRLKRKFSRHEDAHECNDDFKLAWAVGEKTVAVANLMPDAGDADYYALLVPNPNRHAPAEEPPPAPLPVKVRFERRENPRVDLRVELFNGAREKLAEARVRDEGELEFKADKYGAYFLKVTPAAVASPWPEDTRYTFRFSIVR